MASVVDDNNNQPDLFYESGDEVLSEDEALTNLVEDDAVYSESSSDPDRIEYRNPGTQSRFVIDAQTLLIGKDDAVSFTRRRLILTGTKRTPGQFGHKFFKVRDVPAAPRLNRIPPVSAEHGFYKRVPLYRLNSGYIAGYALSVLLGKLKNFSIPEDTWLNPTAYVRLFDEWQRSLSPAGGVPKTFASEESAAKACATYFLRTSRVQHFCMSVLRSAQFDHSRAACPFCIDPMLTPGRASGTAFIQRCGRIETFEHAARFTKAIGNATFTVFSGGRRDSTWSFPGPAAFGATGKWSIWASDHCQDVRELYCHVFNFVKASGAQAFVYYHGVQEWGHPHVNVIFQDRQVIHDASLRKQIQVHPVTLESHKRTPLLAVEFLAMHDLLRMLTAFVSVEERVVTHKCPLDFPFPIRQTVAALEGNAFAQACYVATLRLLSTRTLPDRYVFRDVVEACSERDRPGAALWPEVIEFVTAWMEGDSDEIDFTVWGDYEENLRLAKSGVLAITPLNLKHMLEVYTFDFRFWLPMLACLYVTPRTPKNGSNLDFDADTVSFRSTKFASLLDRVPFYDLHDERITWASDTTPSLMYRHDVCLWDEVRLVAVAGSFSGWTLMFSSGSMLFTYNGAGFHTTSVEAARRCEGLDQKVAAKKCRSVAVGDGMPFGVIFSVVGCSNLGMFEMCEDE
jgi:hypothetical protein